MCGSGKKGASPSLHETSSNIRQSFRIFIANRWS
jgi:hypothetical protein